ncbi:MAG: ClpXP protease specificity-enhancing factor SspB [Pseudomonadota bacterium]
MTDPTSINYGRYMERAMRSVMAEVLGQVAREGLGAGHHFYITFETQHPGVDMPAYLKERYPSEMMIVLQEWYEDLAVMADRFRVTLNFADQPETLVIPFEAVKTFIDPSVKFGLKFDDQDDEGADMSEFNAGPHLAEDERAEAEDQGPEDDPDGGPGGGPQSRREGASADIVSLDRFRKS